MPFSDEQRADLEADLDPARIKTRRLGHPPNTLGKFWSQVRPGPNGCLEWAGTCGRNGYGRYQYQGKTRGTHRVAWEALRGPIPARMLVCHHCDNPRCVNVAHLFLGTALDNNRDAHRKGRAITPTCPTAAKARGERIGGAKLTEGKVRAIKRALSSGAAQSALARAYGVSRAAVNLIAIGRNWKHVEVGGDHVYA